MNLLDEQRKWQTAESRKNTLLGLAGSLFSSVVGVILGWSLARLSPATLPQQPPTVIVNPVLTVPQPPAIATDRPGPSK